MTGRIAMLMILLSLALSPAAWADPTVAAVTHTQFQAVNAAGEQTYNATEKVILEGIALHNPADMLDPTPDDTITAMYNISAQWQLFFQGEGPDHAGTAVYLGQLYNNLPWVAPDGGYSNAEFIAELARINTPAFSPGARIRLTGYFLSYKGKNNVNEQHNKAPDHDFTIEVLDRGVGIPRPEPVGLDELKDADDKFIFDPTRATGPEHHQARLIKLQDLFLVNPQDWAPNATLTLTDGVRTIPLKLGRGNGIYRGSNNLVEPFDVIAILDQDSTNLKDGYRLYVMNYDGNGHVLACREHRHADRPGDTNLDGIVDFHDLARLAADWLQP